MLFCHQLTHAGRLLRHTDRKSMPRCGGILHGGACTRDPCAMNVSGVIRWWKFATAIHQRRHYSSRLARIPRPASAIVVGPTRDLLTFYGIYFIYAHDTVPCRTPASALTITVRTRVLIDSAVCTSSMHASLLSTRFPIRLSFDRLYLLSRAV